MEELRFSIDEQNYDDRHGQVLTLGGWYTAPGNRELDFRLSGDGKRIELPAVQRHPRPDVAEALELETGGFLPGFTVRIPGIDRLSEQYERLELSLADTADGSAAAGEQGGGTIIWQKNRGELKAFLRDSLILYHLDRVEILYDTMLEIQGWALNQRGTAQTEVLNEDRSALACRMSRGRRPDVVERRGLDDDYKEREIGFRISISLNEIRGKRVLLRFSGSGTEKQYEIDVQELRKANKPRGFFSRLLHPQEEKKGGYEEWLTRHSPIRRELRAQRKTCFAKEPLISIVIPLYLTPLPFFEELLQSVKNQTYANWQLCLADAGTDDKLQKHLEQEYRREKRISYRRLDKNLGISGNTNAAIEMVKGEYLLLCDHDDILTPDALYEIVKAINENEDADVIYTDEDKVSMDGRHYFDPHFKSDYNLFRLRENNYICHIFAVKRELAQRAGYLRPEYDGAQDYDFILRCCERAEQVVHIPKVLYHWRCHMESTAADPESKAYAFEAGRKAVQEHYARLGIPAKVERTERPGWYRSRVEIQGEPLISIIIPNKDHTDDLELCLSSIEERSTYRNYEILIVENNSELPETFEYYKTLPEKYPKARVLTWEREFNYSAINNFAAEQAKGDYLLFLNNDVEILTPDWLEEMLQICQQRDVSIVGAKLYYPDDTIQHAGVVLGLGGIAGHIMCRASREDPGYFGRMVSVQEISAVTAACMMMRTEDFRRAQGFDEGFTVAFNDIDLCMKARAMGKKVVFTPYAELYHYESKSRGLEDTPEKQFRFDKEIARFREKWGGELAKGDPYYSPNLSVTEGDCSLRED